MKHKHLISEIPDIVVYVVKCHEKVLYVGMTGIGVINRLRNHLGSNSPLGKAIKENKPFSDDWMVDLYGMRDRASAYNIESQLAHSLSPALNR